MKSNEFKQADAMRFVREARIRSEKYRDIEGAAEWCKKGLAQYPDDIDLRNLSAIFSVERGNYTVARQIFKRLLRRKSTPERWHTSLMNNIAYTDALMGDPALLPEADRYSEEAYRGFPDEDFIVGTRGMVLVEMGKYEEGVKLLNEATDMYDTAQGKAVNFCHLSIAYTRMGDPDKAAKSLKKARRLDSRCFVLKLAEAEAKKVVRKAL
jgi:tetratricopeptide (TPR) repeat protein